MGTNDRTARRFTVRRVIDFEKAAVFKLQTCDPGEVSASVAPLAIDGEDLVATFKGGRDHIVFTNKRVIAATSRPHRQEA